MDFLAWYLVFVEALAIGLLLAFYREGAVQSANYRASELQQKLDAVRELIEEED